MVTRADDVFFTFFAVCVLTLKFMERLRRFHNRLWVLKYFIEISLAYNELIVSLVANGLSVAEALE